MSQVWHLSGTICGMIPTVSEWNHLLCVQVKGFASIQCEFSSFLVSGPVSEWNHLWNDFNCFGVEPSAQCSREYLRAYIANSLQVLSALIFVI